MIENIQDGTTTITKKVTVIRGDGGAGGNNGGYSECINTTSEQ